MKFGLSDGKIIAKTRHDAKIDRANFGKPHVLDHQMKGLMDDVYINGVRVASWDIFSLGNICDQLVFPEKTNLHSSLLLYFSLILPKYISAETQEGNPDQP